MNIIKPMSFAAVALKKGNSLRIVDLEGGQVADLTAFNAHESSEWLSNGRSFDYGGTIRFTTGATLYSNRSRAMFSITEDTVGRHDFLYTACSDEMYRIQYGTDGYHPNCLDNLREGLGQLDIDPVEIPTPFNVFMNVSVREDGRLVVEPPISGDGDSVVFRAEMDLAIAISACPSETCNGGSQKSIGFEIVA